MDYEEDLRKILERSGHVDDFWGKYKQRLKFLEDWKENCYKKTDWFEHLKDASDLYSIKFSKSQKNIRIIFAFVEYKNVKYAILLYPFQEKDGKNNSRYSYDTAIPIAHKRLKEVLEND